MVPDDGVTAPKHVGTVLMSILKLFKTAQLCMLMNKKTLINLGVLTVTVVNKSSRPDNPVKTIKSIDLSDSDSAWY